MQDFIKPVSQWLVLNVGAADAPAILRSAMQFLISNRAQQSRLALIFTSVDPGAPEMLMRVIHAATLQTGRLDKVPSFLMGLANNLDLWKRLSTARKGSIEKALALANDFGLNLQAMQRMLSSDASADGLKVFRIFTCHDC